MHDVEVTVVSKGERPCYGEGIHPGKHSIKEVTGNVEALIPLAKLHHITVITAKNGFIF